ncbi:MAG: exo-alpha-sialidase [Candidatus Omnitrophica bacterium]|nr:exo-alpha-sialidase [Candidatus Omnitrophota bacterium]
MTNRIPVSFIYLLLCFVPILSSPATAEDMNPLKGARHLGVVPFGDGKMGIIGQPDSGPDGGPIQLSDLDLESRAWGDSRTVIQNLPPLESLEILSPTGADEIWMLTVEPETDGTRLLNLRQSGDNGQSWSSPQTLSEKNQPYSIAWTMPRPTGGAYIGLVDESDGFEVIEYDDTDSNEKAEASQNRASSPILIARDEGAVDMYFTRADQPRRYRRVRLASEGGIHMEWLNLPSAVTGESPERTADITSLADGRMVAVGNDNVLRTEELSIRFSYDGGKTWPDRQILDDRSPSAEARLFVDKESRYHIFYLKGDVLQHTIVGDDWALEPTRLHTQPRLANVVPPLDWEDQVVPAHDTNLPVKDRPFLVHVRAEADQADWEAASHLSIPDEAPGVGASITTAIIRQGTQEFVGTSEGLYLRVDSASSFTRFKHHGVHGPLAETITGLAIDSRNTLWVTTPAGLSSRNASCEWRTMRGREGLPWEELTCIAIDSQDRIWLGSTRGMIQYLPYEGGRQWFYRAGPRYLPGDRVEQIALEDEGGSLLAKTDQGYGRIEEVTRTLYSKAEYLEKRYNERHRRLGLASLADYRDDTLKEWTHTSQPSDGLWTSYHVTAMSLAYSLTGEERYWESAKKSMEALYFLQDVTGIKGLVARTVAEVGSTAAEGMLKQDNWHEALDPRYIWRDDVSSDQLDGHFFAFYSYFENVAQFDPIERERIEKQVRQVLDYILENNYRILDLDGEPTLWGWWDPERVNDNPNNYLESGLYSLMMLSFLQVAQYITDDPKYLEHYRDLIEKQGYLSNLLLEKKHFPDELNHSDDQLSAVAYYPILQLEHNPFIRDALHAAARRHAAIEVPERNTLFQFVYATIDPKFADVEGGLRTLREYPQDRRFYAMRNSHRSDVVFNPRVGRFGDQVLIEVLPYDEHHFERWNQDPYRPDSGGNGLTEGSGEQYLLPYWMARFHGLLTPPVE